MEALPTAAGEKRKRRITESRRRQGREAQKRYREKQKENQSSSSTSSKTSSSKAVDTSRRGEYGDADNQLVKTTSEGTPAHAALSDGLWTYAEDPQKSGAGLGDTLDVSFLPTSPAQRAGAMSPMGRRGSQGMTLMDGIQAYLDAPSIPMDSYLRVRRLSSHAACIQNAYILGVTFVKIKDHTCGDGKLPSPWIVQLPGYNAIGSASMRDSTPDLVPTPAQLLHPHDLYIDVLPFPELRERLIELKTSAPKFFDENEFVFDLNYRDAMQCWGPTPWEAKSWEAQKWFLQKWWMITGGEHGELAKASRWWRQLRGQVG